MKQLILVRHAEAVSDLTGCGDHERPLSAQGQKQAQNLAHWLSRQKIAPQKIFSSSATRTRQTGAILATSVFGNPDHMMIDHELYLANAAKILQQISPSMAQLECILVVLHNPGVSELARQLLRETIPPEISSFPTAGACVMAVPSALGDVDGQTTLRSFFINTGHI
jgi:phosphohistidine phosphatase